MERLVVWLTPVRDLVETGGPVVLILLITSVLTVAVILYKIWQFAAAGVGRHRRLSQAIAAWDHGDRAAARDHLKDAVHYLVPLFRNAVQGRPTAERLIAEAEVIFARLEKGFRLLDTVAQLAPLLGLFGTVLGMIDAFQALEDAGSQVDPSVLAGGIWVALLTTAAGLSVAMPAALALSWFEGRMAAERILADKMLQTLLSPGGQVAPREPAPRQSEPGGVAHA